MQLLLLCELECYREKVPNEKDLQDEWRKAVTHPSKYVNLLVGKLNDEDLRLEIDEENHYNSEPWDLVTKNFFLAYHQVKAQASWFASRSDEAEHFKMLYIDRALCIAQEVPGKDLCFIFVCTNGLQIDHLGFAALV